MSNARDRAALDPVPLLGFNPATFFQEFHDPTMVASWRIIGDTLECWGEATSDGTGTHNIVFPKTYDAAPNITGSGENNANGSLFHYVSITTTGAEIRMRNDSTSAVSRTFKWRTIGKWDGVS